MNNYLKTLALACALVSFAFAEPDGYVNNVGSGYESNNPPTDHNTSSNQEQEERTYGDTTNSLESQLQNEKLKRRMYRRDLKSMVYKKHKFKKKLNSLNHLETIPEIYEEEERE